MARSTGFDFDANRPAPGAFHFTRFDTGKVMVGWGRSYKTPWVQLDQAEIVNFLACADQMYAGDDPALAGLLGQVAKQVTAARDEARRQQPLTLEAVSVLAADDEEVGPMFATILSGKAAGNITKALELLKADLIKAGKL